MIQQLRGKFNFILEEHIIQLQLKSILEHKKLLLKTNYHVFILLILEELTCLDKVMYSLLKAILEEFFITWLNFQLKEFHKYLLFWGVVQLEEHMSPQWLIKMWL